ncbi:MAG TPA: MMPL family transporter [Azospira sp.]|nr:MMPL family transporter [Azospira sp.]
MTQRLPLPLLLWLVALAACLAIVGRSQFTADMSAFLPRSPTPQQQLLVDQLKQGVLSRTLLLGIEGGDGSNDDTSTRARLSQALAQRMEASGDFVSVRNGDAAVLEKDRKILFSHRYLLSPAVTAEHFSIPGLHEAIGNSIDLLASPAGLLLKQLLTQDPTGEMVALLGDLGSNGGPVLQGGVWVSRDGKRAILMAQTRAEGSDTDAQEQTLARLRADFGSAAARLGIADARLVVSGAPVFSVDARETIRADVTRFSLISTVGIVALLLLIYRSATALALGLLPVASGALAGIAAVSLGFGTVHGITIGFGTTLIGEAVDYTIYYFVQSQQPGASGEAGNDADWRSRFWPTIRLGVLTSVCGFASLLFSGFPGLAQLGLYSISGLIAAAAVTRFVLPLLLPRGFRIRDISGLGRSLVELRARTARLDRLRWLVAVLSLAALAVLGLHRDGLWATGLSSLSPIPPAAQQLDQSLRAELGAPDMRYLVAVPAPDREAALAAAERIGAELQPLVESGVIAGFDSPARYLPSIAAQRARQQALPERQELARRLPAALDGLPLQAARLAPFLDAVEEARQQRLLTAADLEGSTLALAVDALLLQRQHDWVALLPLRSGESAAGTAATALRPEAIQPALARAGQSHALFLDLQGESTRLYVTYLHEAILLSLAGFVAIVLLLALALRSPARLLRVLAPLVASVLMVIAGLALAGEALTLLHLIGMLLIVAVGSNYALFFVGHAGAGEPGAVAPATLASLLIANVATVIGFGALAFSNVPVLHALGITVGPGAILALILAAILSPQSGRSPAP